MSAFVSAAGSHFKNLALSLGIVAHEDWEQAQERATDPDDLKELVRLLTQTPSSWSTGTPFEFPALTKFQASLLARGDSALLRMDHYVLLESLGSGAHGEVFKARNTRIPRIEAIKILKPSQNTPTARKRFTRELALMASLRHPSFASIHFAGSDNNRLYFAMDYVTGCTLRKFIDGTIPCLPSIRQALDWTMTISGALAAAHDIGIVHRDLKPENLVITPDSEVVILDLGIAKLSAQDSTVPTAHTITAEYVRIGSPEVMSPEQWEDGHSATPASDFYSLGCCLYFMLTGRMPFDKDRLMEGHLAQKPQAPSDFRVEIPERIDQIVLKMLQKDPAERYQHGNQVMDDLLKVKPGMKSESTKGSGTTFA